MIAKFINHLKKAERGQSIIILAFAFVVLLGFVGLTTDVSLMFVRYATIRRAVDSASLAAASQMRQGTEEAAVQIAAKQFVEFHGLDSVNVLVETCQTLDRASSDPDVQAVVAELCTEDQRKLVKVTVQAESPTAFLKLLGWDSFTLQASAISETAALDVILIMDVSESMLTETTYDDWAKIGMGWIYEPPHVAGQIAVDKGADPSIYWQDEILRAPGGQSEVNARLAYNFNNFSAPYDTLPLAGTQDADYEVTVKALDGDPLYETADFPSNASEFVPRPSCRVRLFPASQLEGPNRKNGRNRRSSEPATPEIIPLDDLFVDFGINWNYPAFNDKWNGFVPTYDYFACCNDPGTNKTNADGSPVYQDNGYVEMASRDADFNFTDLVCQPFKGARDAVELFLEKIDFIRGDRVAFVTFDRSAFLVNPWNQVGQVAGGSHMIDRYDYALDTLRRVIGVKAEPNFYVWDDTVGGLPDINAGWGALGAGIERRSGIATSVAINYDSADGSGTLYASGTPFGATERIDHNYPVAGNCFFTDATLPVPYSLNNGTLGAISHPYLAGVAQDDSTAQIWGNYQVATSSGALGQNLNFSGLPDWYKARIGYEYYAACRGTNIGAALREGNNALLDPNTSRRFGAIWVMVLLSDGAAGASDPVRRNGAKLDTADPYVFDALTNTFQPFQGEYGSFGVCPYGSPSVPGEVVDVIPEMDAVASPQFPFCSDEDPASRNECDFRPAIDAEAMRDNDFDPTPLNVSGAPITDSAEILQWNQDRGNLYDIDIGTIDPISGNPQLDCTLFDVDDYAREWADFIALRDENAITEELLPTIYTIGFGLTFDGEPDPDTARANSIGDYLGEQMLRYIADVGDNNQLDNDYYQNYAEESSVTEPLLSNGEYGNRGPCQDPSIVPGVTGYDFDASGGLSNSEIADMYGPLDPRDSCGNYFNAPNADELEFVFDSIASKLFTRLTG